MELNQRLYDAFSEKAHQVKVQQVCLGLGYSSVTTSDGGIGVSYTYFDRKTGCCLVNDDSDYEGRPAMDLLTKIKSRDPIQRSMALALINALNHTHILNLPPDLQNGDIYTAIGIGPSTRLAMVGFFQPLMKQLEKRGAIVEVIDEFRGMGDKDRFCEKLSHWADAVIITSTSLLNNTAEEILGYVGQTTKTALIGPSTPMVAEAFNHLPVHALAGIVPLEAEPIMKAVRHGLGTRHLHRYSKKVTLTL